MAAAPKASVGVPVRNGGRYLLQSLRSAQEQSLEDIEIIVSDNASDDGSADLVAELARDDERIRLIRQPTNLGAAGNYNAVFHAARSPYFRWHAADDLMPPTLLERCVSRLDASPAAGLVYPRTELIDAEGAHLRYHEDDLDLRAGRAWARACGFVRRVGLCSPAFGVHRRSVLAQTRLIQPFVGADAVLLFEIALRATIEEQPDALFQRRVHAAASYEAARSRADLLAWWDPRRRVGRWQLPPRLKLLVEYLRATSRTTDPAAARLWTATAVTSTWAYRRLRVRAGRLRRALRGGSTGGEPRDRFGELLAHGDRESPVGEAVRPVDAATSSRGAAPPPADHAESRP